MSKPVAVLFVCMGNICRSPTAEGVFRQRAMAAGLAQRFLIDSAGTHGYHVGEPPDARSMEFAIKRGFDLVLDYIEDASDGLLQALVPK